MKFSTVRGTYHYEIYGEGPPLVMLHGFTGSRQTWYPMVSQWKKSFQLILIDLPGHGKSTITEELTMAECCADIHAFIKHLELETVTLLGYSMGGRTALSFTMDYPNMVDTLVLESASPGLNTMEERRRRQQKDDTLAEWIEMVGVSEFVQYWENIPLFATQKALSTNIQNQIKQERLNQTKEGLALSLRSMGTGRQPNWWPKLSQLTCNVILLVGELDDKFVHFNTKMSQLIKNSHMVEFMDSGHAIHVEQPEKFGKMVKELLLNSI